MTASKLEKLASVADCEIRCDALTRQLYATDASIYQIVPAGVAFPQDRVQTAEVVQRAAEAGVPITPRGGGTGLAGGAIGEGLILDLARHNRRIADLNVEAQTVRVEAGVILDELNAFLKPHGLAFGPDVAPSSRATLGGMIANNSSGARAPRYGATADHVRNVEVVTATGAVAEVGIAKDGLQEELRAIDALIQQHAPEIRERFHADIVKRWPGYAVDRYLRPGGHFGQIFCGSEGTLAAITSAELSLTPLPKERAMGLVFFDSAAEAMQATTELLELDPVAIEHIDDVLFDQTRGQLQFKDARAFLELDRKPCKSILMVEFYEDVDDKLAALEAKHLGLRTQLCRTEAEIGPVVEVRKAGLSLLTGRPGPAKPTAGIEDVAVPPARLPEYVRDLSALMDGLDLEASFYGHAAAGLLHVRPVVDLHRAEDIDRFRRLAEGVSSLTQTYKGSLSAEHGVGIARTEFMETHLGPLLGMMRDVKAQLDQRGVLNPGKVLPDGRYRIDSHLRWGADYAVPLPFEPVLAFAQKDGSFVGNLEQCNGNGTCRKLAPTMCPTYIATGEEIMSTRGRANTIRAVLDERIGGKDPLMRPELDEALKYCLSCKACKTECPTNVDLALQKAELTHARHRQYGVPFSTRLISRVDLLGEMASIAPRMANAALRSKWMRRLMERITGLAADRPPPPYARERFDRWFATHKVRGPRKRGTVILWDDCFVRFNEPHIGQAAVRVLEAAGYRVVLPRGRACCGRPAFSTGRLDVARAFGEHNAALLEKTQDPILFLEPSCYSMFSDDYRELGIAGAETIRGRAVLFEHFLEDLLEEAPEALRLDETAQATAIHAHCHAKALTGTTLLPRLARRIPNNEVTLLKTACCGMAGAYGAKRETYAMSLEIGALFRAALNTVPADTNLICSGTSCRHQAVHLTGREPMHMAELFDRALRKG